MKRLFETSLHVPCWPRLPWPRPRLQFLSRVPIGNGAYFYGAFINPVNAADDVAKVLQDAGFDVTLETDADQAEMQGAIW